MAFLKHATVIAALAGAGVVGMAGIASAAADDAWNGGSEHHKAGDNNVGQGGLIPVNALNNVNVAPNLGCLAHNTVPDLTAQVPVVNLVPVPVNVNHLLDHANLNVLANGNIDHRTPTTTPAPRTRVRRRPATTATAAWARATAAATTPPPTVRARRTTATAPVRAACWAPRACSARAA